MSPLTPENKSMTLQKAFSGIHFYRGAPPIDAYEFLIKHEDRSTSHLLQELKNAIQRHGRTGDYYVAHVHALLLLSQFRNKKAYPFVIELLNLPIDAIDGLIGDMISHSLQKIITSVYDGNPEPLFDILNNHEVDKFIRGVVASSLSSLIYQKLIDKELVILRMQEIIASGRMSNDSVFYTALAYMTMNSKLEPLYDIVRAAFKLKIIPNDGINIQGFEETLLKSMEEINQKGDMDPIKSAVDKVKFYYLGHGAISVKIDRNSPCPCGSGQKFKKCCIQMI